MWARLTRFSNDVQVKTLTKYYCHKGLKVIAGGKKLRYPDFIGARKRPNVWLPSFALNFWRDFFMAFATGNLYVFS